MSDLSYGKAGQPRVVGDILAAFLKDRGLLQAIEDRRPIAEWETLVGTALAAETRPLRVERGILWIGVTNAPQANHLQYLCPLILRRIQELYPAARIREIRVLHRPDQGQPCH